MHPASSITPDLWRLVPEAAKAELGIGYGPVKYRIQTNELTDAGAGFYVLTLEHLWLCSSALHVGIDHDRVTSVKSRKFLKWDRLIITTTPESTYDVRESLMNLNGLRSFYASRGIVR